MKAGIGAFRTVLLGVFLFSSMYSAESGASTSINSTSQNRSTSPTAAVSEQAKVANTNFQVFSNNDLGMHCEVADHRVVSLLPPCNVLHGQVVQKGKKPQILTNSTIDLLYSAVSNPNDPLLVAAAQVPIEKTDFWDPNLNTADTIEFDGYNPLYPPGILAAFQLAPDVGIPFPDVERLYLGDGKLVADQQKMPGISDPYNANVPQSFNRFNTDFPFFMSFPFGHVLKGVNWFAAEGIPITPTDDFGRYNPFPLMRVQAVDKTGSLAGTKGAVIASVDAVVPVASEITCYKCHASAQDGGGGLAACIPGVDANCTTQGSAYSRTAFQIATAADDRSVYSADIKREWAVANNIVRLHDALNGTDLKEATPVVCQTCHYSPAIDIAQVGPKGTDDSDGNGRSQKIHHTNSRALHAFHGALGVFPTMPPASDPQRLDTNGKPVVNDFVRTTLENSCYLCHPGKTTHCLRGAMFNGGLVCQDCHGNLPQIGDDFSEGFSSATPFPGGMSAGKRIPWANEPGCQSCHTGDATDNLTADPNVIPARDGIRLLSAYRTNDPSAKPIVAANRRFAENVADSGEQILFRASKDSHSKLSCQVCHGSPHAEWPVVGSAGSDIANDNIAAIQLQGHDGVIIECTACHTAPPDKMNGPHGMHAVGQTWVSQHPTWAKRDKNSCRVCHGAKGEGTVLSKIRADRSISLFSGRRTLANGSLLTCSVCHRNPL